MRKILLGFIGFFVLAGSGTAALAEANQYKVDPGHTFVTFEVSHIGYAWIPGIFGNFEGQFSYDPENPANSSARFTVRTDSLDTFHAERNKHLKSDDFFATGEYPTATFVSSSYEKTGENTGLLKGKLTIRGVTKNVTWQVDELGAGEDPWGNYRRGFEAETTVNLKEFGFDYNLGPTKEATIRVSVEGTRQ